MGRPVSFTDKGTHTEFIMDDGSVQTVWGEPAAEVRRTAEAAGAVGTSEAPDQSTTPQLPADAPQVLAGQALGITGRTVQQAQKREAWNRLSPTRQETELMIQQGKPIYSPGRPEVDPVGQMGADPLVPGSRSGYVTTQRSATVVPAQPVSEEDREALLDIDIDEKMLRATQTDRAIAENVDAGMQAQTRAIGAREKMDAWEARQRDIDAEVQRERAKLAQLHEAVANHKVDPNRLFSGNIMAGIGAAIAIGLGAGAATLAGTRNFAQEQINAAIDRDIDAQKAERDKLGMAANNTLTRLEQHFGDRRQAELALEQLQHAAVEQERAALIARTNIPKLQEEYQAYLMAKEKEQLARKMEFDLRAKDRVIQRQETQPLVQYQEGRRGGVGRRPYTLEEQMKLRERVQQHEERMGLTESPEQRSRRELAEAKAGHAQEKADQKLVVEFGKRRENRNSARGRIEDALRRFREQQTKSGGIPGVGIGSESPGTKAARGVGMLLGSEHAEQASANRQLLKGILAQGISSMVRGVASDADVQRIEDAMLGEYRTEEETIQGLETMLKSLDEADAMDDATYGANVRTEWARRNREAQRERSGVQGGTPR